MEAVKQLQDTTREQIVSESDALVGLLQTVAADNFSASCPNPSVLERCPTAGIVDRFNRVVDTAATPRDSTM